MGWNVRKRLTTVQVVRCKSSCQHRYKATALKKGRKIASRYDVTLEAEDSRTGRIKTIVLR